MNAITTSKSWKDILPEAAGKNLLQLFDNRRQITRSAEIANSSSHARLFLFHGEAGENKVAAAALAGAQLGTKAFRINLSEVVSKYIGETEKNINIIFSRVTDKNAILFFDEADALFGKRTEIKDSHDKYANQEVNYLLQKIASYNGTAIFSIDKKERIPPSILHRFRHVINFPPHKKD